MENGLKGFIINPFINIICSNYINLFSYLWLEVNSRLILYDSAIWDESFWGKEGTMNVPHSGNNPPSH